MMAVVVIPYHHIEQNLKNSKFSNSPNDMHKNLLMALDALQMEELIDNKIKTSTIEKFDQYFQSHKTPVPNSSLFRGNVPEGYSVVRVLSFVNGPTSTNTSTDQAICAINSMLETQFATLYGSKWQVVKNDADETQLKLKGKIHVSDIQWYKNKFKKKDFIHYKFEPTSDDKSMFVLHITKLPYVTSTRSQQETRSFSMIGNVDIYALTPRGIN